VYQSAPMAARMFGVTVGALPEIDRFIEEGEVIEVGRLSFEVMFVPGHAPGHVAFIERSLNAALSGDLLFAGSIGRTDLPGCNAAYMMESLRRFAQLPSEMRVFPGHGPATTVGHERRTNPFLRGVRDTE